MPYAKGENPNHPVKGSILGTQPFRNREDIDAIKNYLLHRHAYREYLLFTIGINSALRVKDLLEIKWDSLLALNPIERVIICRETKTGKVRRIIANDFIIEAIAKCREHLEPELGRYVFVGKRGRIQSETVTAWVKEWAHAVGLKGRFGGRTLRQTWVYHCVKGGVLITTLMKMLNHSSQAITLRYACIRDEDSDNTYLNIKL